MFGMSGHLQVLSELFRRGYNAAIPLVDNGDDAIVINEADKVLYRLQVKSANSAPSDGPPPRSEGQALEFQFTVSRKQLRNPDGAELYYMFMAWAWDEWSWILIARKKLSELKEEEEMRSAAVKLKGRPRKSDAEARDDKLTLTIRFTRGDAAGRRDAVLWGKSLSDYLRRWPQEWPDLGAARTSL